ncbi:MAG: PspA/IM30 family protein [Proteobacteria bacterium]|nr:PspA/IM30 family protein [Pseudomonadota bacterium]
MFKHIMTLLRGQAQQAEDAFADRNALPILNQQIRDAARGLEAARRALAAAMAQARMEKENTARLSARKLDLEGRALTALQSGREDLATEAATTLAALEDDLANAERAEAEYAQGIDKLSRIIKAGETRLTDLERGKRLAVARDRAQRLTHSVHGQPLATLEDAEATLSRLKTRQQQTDATAQALSELTDTGPEALVRKLADAGCGKPVGTKAEDVLARLRSRLNTIN